MLYVAPPLSLLLEEEMVLYLTTVFIGATIRIYTNILAKIKKTEVWPTLLVLHPTQKLFLLCWPLYLDQGAVSCSPKSA